MEMFSQGFHKNPMLPWNPWDFAEAFAHASTGMANGGKRKPGIGKTGTGEKYG